MRIISFELQWRSWFIYMGNPSDKYPGSLFLSACARARAWLCVCASFNILSQPWSLMSVCVFVSSFWWNWLDLIYGSLFSERTHISTDFIVDYRSGCFRVQGTKNLIKTNVETEKLKKIWNQWLVDGFPHLALSHVQCTQFNHRMPGKQLSVSVSLSLLSALSSVFARFLSMLFIERAREKKFFVYCCCHCCYLLFMAELQLQNKRRTWHNSFTNHSVSVKMDGNQYVNRFQQVETRLYSFHEWNAFPSIFPTHMFTVRFIYV